MEHWLDRTRILLSEKQLEKLQFSHVLVAGLGGVGGYAAESICRAGVGKLTIVDHDVLTPTNINRQLLGLHSELGRNKVEVMKDRLLDINPELKLVSKHSFLIDDRIDALLQTSFDYIVDAIDTLSPKVYLIKTALDRKYPIISSLGAGGKFDPSLIRVTDIGDTTHCNLGRILRKRLHKLNIHSGFKAVYSEESVKNEFILQVENEQNKKTTVGTISYMPPMFGLYMAAEVIRDLISTDK